MHASKGGVFDLKDKNPLADRPAPGAYYAFRWRQPAVRGF